MLVSSMTIGLMGCSTINDIVNNIESKKDTADKVDNGTNKVATEDEKNPTDTDKPIADSSVENKILNVGIFLFRRFRLC